MNRGTNEGAFRMIQIVAKNKIKADKTDAFIALAKQLVALTVQNDAGCLRYELFQDLADPQILTMIEEWENAESLKKHAEAKHFKDAAARFGELLEGPGEVNRYRKLA